MHQRQKRVLQNLFIGIAVPLLSLCATLILLYIFVPRQPATAELVPITPPATSPIATPMAPVVATVATPAQLMIEGINVAAAINSVGVNTMGDMDIDDDATKVAWYKLGPKPGEEGSAVIAGHYGWKDGVSSVFNNLSKLVKGDTISTIGEDGVTKTFVVTRSEIYAPDQDATYVFKSDDGKAHLNLITCQGSWNNSAQTYSERLVVFTDLVL